MLEILREKLRALVKKNEAETTKGEVPTAKAMPMAEQLRLVSKGYAGHASVTPEARHAATLAIYLRYLGASVADLEQISPESLENVYILWNCIFDNMAKDSLPVM